MSSFKELLLLPVQIFGIFLVFTLTFWGVLEREPNIMKEARLREQVYAWKLAETRRKGE